MTAASSIHWITHLLLVLCCLGARTASAQEAAPSGLGTSKTRAIEVCKPNGEREYLARLICPDHSHPTFNRTGSVGLRNEFPEGMSEEEMTVQVTAAMTFKKLEPGTSDHHMIDRYIVECGEAKTSLYLDMYHCDAPATDAAPDGFTFLR